MDSVFVRYLDTYGYRKMASWQDAQYSVGRFHIAGYDLAIHMWSLDNPKGTAFVAHGLFDHVGLFLDLIDVLVSAGYQVIAIDFPGHGLSEGKPVSIPCFSEYGTIIEQCLSRLENKIHGPVYGIGQSTGSAAILNYVLVSRGRGFDKIILLCPLIMIRSWFWVSLAYATLHTVLNQVPRRFKPNVNREGFNDFLDRGDPLQSRHVSVEWVGAMKQWAKLFPGLQKSEIPALVYQGDSDETVWWEKNLPLLQSKLSLSEVNLVEGGMHHLVNEIDVLRDPVFERIIQFLSA